MQGSPGWCCLAVAVSLVLGCGSNVPVDSDSETATTSGEDSSGTASETDGTWTQTTAGSTSTTGIPPADTLDVGTPQPPDLPPLQESDTYLLVVYTPLDFDLPLQFRATLDLAEPATLTLVPLSVDVGSQSAPREEVGDARTATVTNDDGRSAFQFPEMTIPGAANPITGGDTLLDLVLIPNFAFGFCGAVEGMIHVPIDLDLLGSQFGAVAIGDGPLPLELPAACPVE